MEDEEPHSHSHSQSQSQRASLPPGCRFYPSEELLLRYYLTNKNANRDGDFYGSDLITELDLYNHDPFELPDASCFSYGYRGSKRHWYCYTVRVVKDARRVRMKVKTGFWLRKGRVRDVFGNGGNVLLGTRTRFVFYVGNSPKNATRTDRILYEYALVDHLLGSFVLCRVFVKEAHHNKNSPSEIGLSCCAEESVSAVRHVGVQYDGYARADVVEGRVCDDSSVDRKNGCASEQDDRQVLTEPVSVAPFQCSAAGPQGCQQERLSGLPGGSALFIEAVTSRQLLLSILEEDFIELNDLA
ncbi:NAC domain-containing protein 72-like [Gastrolobium bilobum]|uniref:NAC domain-containing protein 72-like n=1 Tax=Gastrolobium bilobum TaxID=150636 RepID=UPI002AB23A16|nr:NAC domain-containing protein 72-like [Gastrolobium bilobum]